MFDFITCFSHDICKESLQIRSGKNFPPNVDIDFFETLTEWYYTVCYSYKNVNHSWRAKKSNIQLFVMGQVFFRFDSEYSETDGSAILEEIIQIYKDCGISVTKHIKGNFILFFFDEEQHNLTIVTSKSCLYSLYYADWEGKYYFSTSLENILSLSKVFRQVNPISLIEHSIFDFPLGNKSIFKNIGQLNQGHICTLDTGRISVTKWHDWETEIKEVAPKYNWKETYRLTPDLFNRIIKMQIEGKDKLISALTGGFDSRTVLSGLEFLKKKHTLYYAWGKREFMDVIVPQKITKKLGLDFMPIYLETEFESEFVKRGESAIQSSDGRATLRRANHFYSYSRLSEFSHYNFTGLYGSELLRPISAFGHTFNKCFFDIFTSKTMDATIELIYSQEVKKNFLNRDLLQANKQIVIEDIKAYFLDLKKDLPDHVALYKYHLNEGLINYFGHEIHGTRFFVTTYSPYLDDEFVEFLFQTPMLNLNQKAFKRNLKKSIWDIRKGQLFYIPIIKQNSRKLMNFNTGRFYTPSQLSSVFYPLSILHAVLPYRMSKKNRSFGTEIWIKRFIEEHSDLAKLENNCFAPLPEYEPGMFIEYAKQMSIRYWIALVNSELK